MLLARDTLLSQTIEYIRIRFGCLAALTLLIIHDHMDVRLNLSYDSTATKLNVP